MNLVTIPGSVESPAATAAAVKSARASAFFARPAVFVSALSPGLVAGGSQCTLAFLQAVCELHEGRVTWVGPEFVGGVSREDLALEHFVDAPERSLVQKVRGALIDGHADRTTPAAAAFLRENCPPNSVVYVNGEVAGQVVALASKAAKHGERTTVFIPHNHAREYARSENDNPLLWRWVYRRNYCRAARIGHEQAAVRLFLTRSDRHAYEAECGQAEGASRSLDGMYFGYRPLAESAPIAVANAAQKRFTLLINTNLSQQQNEAGVLSFLHEVWPKIRDQIAGSHLILAGRNPRPSIQEAVSQYPGVELISRPEPDEMEQIFQRSSICLATTEGGSGIKLRVAEALRRGLAVVSTPSCARGYEDVAEDLLKVRNSPAEFAGAIVDLHRADLNTLSDRCRSCYAEQFSFEAGMRKMQQLGDLPL